MKPFPSSSSLCWLLCTLMSCSVMSGCLFAHPKPPGYKPPLEVDAAMASKLAAPASADSVPPPAPKAPEAEPDSKSGLSDSGQNQSLPSTAFPAPGQSSTWPLPGVQDSTLGADLASGYSEQVRRGTLPPSEFVEVLQTAALPAPKSGEAPAAVSAPAAPASPPPAPASEPLASVAKAAPANARPKIDLPEPEKSEDLDFYQKVLLRYRDCVIANAKAEHNPDMTPAQAAQEGAMACQDQFDILRGATEKYVVSRVPSDKVDLAKLAAEHHARQVRVRVLRKAAAVVTETRAAPPT